MSESSPTITPTSPLVFIDADSDQITELLAQSRIYIKDVTVQAYQVSAEHLKIGGYATHGVHPDGNGGFVIDTYVMVETADGRRIPQREGDSQPVRPGDWIVINPAKQPGDYPNCYAKTDQSFRERYEPTARSYMGTYRAKGLIRLAKNPVAAPVITTAYWGSSQTGDAECYFCAPVNRQNLDDLGLGQRYLLSANDFQTTYKPVEEVLGADWRNHL